MQNICIFRNNIAIIYRFDTSIEHISYDLYRWRKRVLGYACRNKNIGVNNSVCHTVFCLASLTAFISALISSRVISGPDCASAFSLIL